MQSISCQKGSLEGSSQMELIMGPAKLLKKKLQVSFNWSIGKEGQKERASGLEGNCNGRFPLVLIGTSITIGIEVNCRQDKYHGRCGQACIFGSALLISISGSWNLVDLVNCTTSHCCMDVRADDMGAGKLKKKSHRRAPDEKAAAREVSCCSVYALLCQSEMGVVPLADPSR